MSEFKAQAAEVLKRLGETDQAIVLTQNGKAAGVLLSPRDYDALSERLRVIDAIEEGLRDADAGEVVSQAEARKRLVARTGQNKTR